LVERPPRLLARWAVMAVVEEHVDEHVPHLTRRRELAPVVPVTKQATMAPSHRIDHRRDAREELLEETRDLQALLPLDDQVNVLHLHGVVNDASPRLLAPAVRACDLFENAVEIALDLQARPAGHAVHRYVHRMLGVVKGARAVGNEP